MKQQAEQPWYQFICKTAVEDKSSFTKKHDKKTAQFAAQLTQKIHKTK